MILDSVPGSTIVKKVDVNTKLETTELMTSLQSWKLQRGSRHHKVGNSRVDHGTIKLETPEVMTSLKSLFNIPIGEVT